MLVEIGHFALVLALLVALVQGTVPLVGASVRSRPLMDLARSAALLQFGLVALAFAIFMHAHIVSDFSVRNVFENSNTAKPMLYKVTGVWGSHEGSMMLWVLMLTLFGGLVAALGRSLPVTLRARTLAIQGLLGFGTLAFIIGTSNPFDRLIPAPVDGRDLNPLLQDPGLAFHPPFLYFGYVGFSITYSFAIAALIEGRIGARWARWVRPWALTAWCGLTIGIAMGSWWAYYVLGWGGWWYWDPVENASFMPWLLGTALLHSAAVVEKRESLQRWTVLLAILTFGMSLIGTFLVRSGVLTSVHSFAVDPTRGVFILVLITLVIGGGLLLYAWRAASLETGNPFAPVSREGALVLNNLLLCAGMATVFLGTFYPLFAEVSSGVKLSVGPQFFDATFVPILMPAIIAMVIGPVLAWRRGKLAAALRRLLPAAIGALVAPAVVFAMDRAAPPAALAGIALAVWAMLGVLTDLADRSGVAKLPVAASWRRLRHLPRGTWGYAIAHFGVGVLIAGITVSTAWRSERIETLRPGETIEIAGRTLRLVGVTEEDVANYHAQRAQIIVERPGSAPMTLHPERRWYPVARSQTTNTAITTNGFGDLYLALGDPDGQGGWVLRAYYNPLVPWIWFGAILAALGGLVSLSDRRLRLRVPAAATRLAATSAGSADN
ncbi:MAG: heme lyase CcmF/NrfE family subunit [Alphaproteobacteria bacterium]|nr:heme lyase CcmF/NrfE family subunit [Alphaproteobacteria bacterium]